MRTYSDMTDERRLKFLQEYLASDQTKREFEKANGLGRNRISRWLRIFATEDKKVSTTLTSSMETLPSKDKSESAAEELHRLRLELKVKQLELKRVTMARDAYEKMILLYGAQNEAYMSWSAEKWVRGLCFNELGVGG